MRTGDREFIQILNIIKRGQRLVQQANREGVNINNANEYITEAKYALKMDQRERALSYAKKCIFEVVKAKREMAKASVHSKKDLSKLSKGELRDLCQQYDLDPIGLKDELVDRLWDNMEFREGKLEGPVKKEPEEKTPPKEKEEKRIEPEGEEKPPQKEKKEEKPKKEKPEWKPDDAIKELTPGIAYLVEENRPDRIFQIYKILREREKPGLNISRTNPKILARRFDLKETDSIWLTGKEIHGDIQSVLPILEFIMSLIEEFMDDNIDGVIVLDGLEYLLTNNKFNSVLRFLRQLVDNVSQTECILLVALSPDAMDQTQVSLLEKDFMPLNYLDV